MGIFDQLRERLFDAVASGDGAALEQGCNGHREAIVANFKDWKTVPAEVRKDPQAVQRWGNGLLQVALFFAQTLNDPQLLQLLTGGGQGGRNPIEDWQARIKSARALIDENRFTEAATDLERLLGEVSGLQGSAVTKLLPLTEEYRGEAYFGAGEVQKAAAPLSRALEIFRADNDADGVVACLQNLYEVHRYLGQGIAAADCAAALAEGWERAGRNNEAAWHRRQAALCRSGMPLNRVIARMGEDRFELDDLPAVISGRLTFVFERNRISFRRASAFLQQGMAHGTKGRFEDALSAFAAASALDQYESDSHYQAALTLRYLERPAEAVAALEKVERLAPGWFNCRADLWLSRELASGRLPHKVFLALAQLEVDGPPEVKVSFVEKLVASYPSVAPLWLERGKCLLAAGRKDDAESSFRQGIACAAEHDLMTQLLLQLAMTLKPGVERSRLLSQAVDLDGNKVAAAMARLHLRATAN